MNQTLLAAKAKEQQIRKPVESVLQKSAEQKPIDTRQEIAKAAGVSHDTIAKVEKIEAQATPEIKAALKSGDISINAASACQKSDKLIDTPDTAPPAIENSFLQGKDFGAEVSNTVDDLSKDEIEYLRHFPLIYRTSNGELAEFWVDDLFDES